MARFATSPQRLLICLLSLGLLSTAARAQQLTIITFNSSSGRSSSSSSTSVSQSAALSGADSPPPEQAFIGQNVRRIVLADGSEAYQIIDINRPFGSYSERVSREREQNVNTRSFSSFTSLGYSVFHQ